MPASVWNWMYANTTCCSVHIYVWWDELTVIRASGARVSANVPHIRDTMSNNRNLFWCQPCTVHSYFHRICCVFCYVMYWWNWWVRQTMSCVLVRIRRTKWNATMIGKKNRTTTMMNNKNKQKNIAKKFHFHCCWCFRSYWKQTTHVYRIENSKPAPQQNRSDIMMMMIFSMTMRRQAGKQTNKLHCHKIHLYI